IKNGIGKIKHFAISSRVHRCGNLYILSSASCPGSIKAEQEASNQLSIWFYRTRSCDSWMLPMGRSSTGIGWSFR
ncbi:MAG TPA: hypothetical protein VEY06_05265, partial [Flavisolibacter sp.]|nr:hypothetical protein [Flavisolibacter sp.]